MLLTTHQIDFLPSQLRRKAQENIYCVYKAYVLISTRVQSDSNLDYKVANIRNEKHRRIQHASPCEGAHGDILHYPRAVLHGGLNDSSSFEVISGIQKMINHRRPFPHADRQISRHEVEQLQNSQRFSGSDDEEEQAPLIQGAPTCGIASRIAENGLHLWTTNRYPFFSKIFGLFFEFHLNYRIRTSDHRPWFSQTKIKLPEKPLALTHTKVNIKFLMDKG